MTTEPKPETPTPQPEPIVIVYPDGRVQIGAGYTIGDVLQACEVVKRQVLSITLRAAA